MGRRGREWNYILNKQPIGQNARAPGNEKAGHSESACNEHKSRDENGVGTSVWKEARLSVFSHNAQRVL